MESLTDAVQRTVRCTKSDYQERKTIVFNISEIKKKHRSCREDRSEPQCTTAEETLWPLLSITQLLLKALFGSGNYLYIKFWINSKKKKKAPVFKHLLTHDYVFKGWSYGRFRLLSVFSTLTAFQKPSKIEPDSVRADRVMISKCTEDISTPCVFK